MKITDRHRPAMTLQESFLKVMMGNKLARPKSQ